VKGKIACAPISAWPRAKPSRAEGQAARHRFRLLTAAYGDLGVAAWLRQLAYARGARRRALVRETLCRVFYRFAISLPPHRKYNIRAVCAHAVWRSLPALAQHAAAAYPHLLFSPALPALRLHLPLSRVVDVTYNSTAAAHSRIPACARRSTSAAVRYPPPSCSSRRQSADGRRRFTA